MKKIKTNFSTRNFKGGAYATATSAVVIAILIVVNLMFTRLNITLDLTADGKYSLTPETITMLDELEDDIVFYYLAPSGESVDMFDKILGQYTKYGDTIKLVTKDPVMNPKFATQYTEAEVEEFSIIVVNETNGRSRYVAYSDMLIEEYGIDYTTYQYYSEVTGLDMEGQLNSAIGYVTMDHLPTLYEASGHGMQSLGTETIAMLEKANLQVYAGSDALDLLTTTEIPEDCDVLLIHTPETDFTEEEVTLLSDYMDAGGNIIFILSYMNNDDPNLLGLMESYGIILEDGIVMESSSRYYMQAPYILVPTVESHEITDGVADNRYIVVQTASGLSMAETIPETVTLTGLLTTSSNAYLKGLDFETYYKEDSDPSGTYYLGIHAGDFDTGGEMAVFSGYYIFNDAYATSSTFGNTNLLVNSVNALADIEVTTTAVRTIDLTAEEYLTLTEAQINGVALIVVILLPLAVLVTGIIWVVYRKKHA